MKSLTLHLSVILLLLGSLHNANNLLSSLAPALAAAAASSPSIKSTTVPTTRAAGGTKPTTTLQPPSLPKPHRHPTTTIATTKAMTTSSTTTTTTTTTTTASAPITNNGRRKPAARSVTAAQGNQNIATTSLDDAATFRSTLLVRNANGTASNVRQNRSFQSGGSSPQIIQRNDNNAADNSGNSNKLQKIQRRLAAHRTSQYGSKTTTPTTTTTTTEEPAASTTTKADKSALQSSFSSKQQVSPSSFMANHHQNHHHQRQSKQQQLQLEQQQEQQLQESKDPPKQQKARRTTKTPRMIQRLVAGHIQNAEGHSTYHVSSVTTNSSYSNTATTPETITKPTTAIYFRRKPQLSSSYRQSKLSTTVLNSSTTTSTTTTTTEAPSSLRSVQNNYDDHDDDEALLDDSDDLDNWDHGILRLSAGAGKENSPKSKKKLEDSKKTLSDQVRDGKYGLIEKELFRRQPKRPGVLSYLPNKEVPFDNEQNYGGLNEEDIWLAEDHLLVIKGGSLNDDELNEPWPPIDDYDAPGRQIKIPSNPKVPPPFPVQLEENGPLQFIGNNKFTIVYPVTNESLPVYPTGPENNYASSESDDEKNLLARPGSPQDPTENEPGYIYPAPSPPWLYHNQTFVNPFLSKARPITFPGLGPFPFGRNSSLNNSNGTDLFDEDDPALYYPPAYSFVYKSNYTNPVPPGPLVPGIVLPPPPDQFSRLEKTTKLRVATAAAPTRQRVHTTTSTTTSTTTTSTTTTSAPTTTTTTTTTTEPPYRQFLTKIHEYKPKTITITSAPPVRIVTPVNPPTRITISKTLPAPIEPVPVPVAVPVPIYPASHFGKAPPTRILYPSSTTTPPVETFSKSNPIYYEYFEPKREPTTANYIDDYDPTTIRPPLPARPIKLNPTSKRPIKLLQGNRNSLQDAPPQRPYVQENLVYITPRPDVRPYNAYKAPPVFKPRPLENFEREVDEIRQTLRFYQNQQLRDNNIPRTPKAKPVFEYAYDGDTDIAPVQPETRSFQPPEGFDEEPFQPMVTYSPPVDDENAFRAIAYNKADNDDSSGAQQQQKQQQQQQRPKYQTTTTLIPVQPSAQYQGRPKKIRLGAAKYLAPFTNVGFQKSHQQQQRYQLEYQSTPRTTAATQQPWVSLDQQEFSEYQQPVEEQQIAPQQQQSQQPQPRYQPERYEIQSEVIAPRNRVFPGYYYGPPPGSPPGRKNNRFYDEPFQNPVRKIVNNYRPPPPQPQQQPVWSLENDTYVNYAPNRPPLNPDAEFIDPYQNIPLSPYGNQGQRFVQQQHQQPQVLSHQSQYYGPPQRFPPRQHPQLQPQQHQPQPQPQYPLHRDVLVNYRQPLPPLNPDSEFITHPHVVRPQIYRTNQYRSAPPPGENSNVYYISPKYRRGSNVNGNGSDNDNNNNGNSNSNQANYNNRGNRQ